MASHMTTHSIETPSSTNGAAVEEVTSPGTIFQEMIHSSSDSPVEVTSSTGGPTGPSGGVSNEVPAQTSEADSVAAVSVGMSLLSTTNTMTNTKMETPTDGPADSTTLGERTSVADKTVELGARSPAASAVVTTAGILQVSHAAIAAASAAMSAQVPSSSDAQERSASPSASGQDANSLGDGVSESKCGSSSGQQGPKKMPMALVNELAKYNKVKAVYVLEDEAGPAHKKTFYIRLEVGEENFHAHGPSIRKAQHAAAEVALQRSNLPRPPPRPAHSFNARGGWGTGLGRGAGRLASGDQRSGNFGGGGPGSCQPVVELNVLAGRRGEEVVYTAMDPPPPHHPATHGYPPALTGSGPPPAAGFRGHGARGSPMTAWGCGPPMSNPMANPPIGPGGTAGGGTVYSGPPPYGLAPGGQVGAVSPHSALHVYQHPGRFPSWSGGGGPYYPGGMGGYPRRFTVLLKVGPREFQGEGVSRQAARNNAANKALRLLRFMPMPTQTLERQREGGDHPYEHQSQATDVRAARTGGNGKNSNASGGDRIDVETTLDDNADDDDTIDSNDNDGDGSEDSNNCTDQPMLSHSNGARKKSDISIVHEVGLKLRQHATFDMVRESGPAHSKVFTYRCKLGPREAEGEGNSKKRSKLAAAKNMLEKLKLEFSETGKEYIIKMCSEVAAQRIDASGEPLKKSNQSRKKNRNLIKAQKTDPEYGQQVNPVSRLIQVQQGRKEADPIFEMVSERGLNKRKEFVYRCSVGDHATEGVGQNKRLAKRQAAEHMLDSLGYKRIEKFPIKSALKNGHPVATVISGSVDVPADGSSPTAGESNGSITNSPLSGGQTPTSTVNASGSSGADLSALSPNPVGTSPQQASNARHSQPQASIPRGDRLSGINSNNSGIKNRPSGFIYGVSNGKRVGGSHVDSGSTSMGGGNVSFNSIGGSGSHTSPIGANKKNVSFSMARGVLYVPEANFPAQQRLGHQQASHQPHQPHQPHHHQQQHPGHHPHHHQQHQHHQHSPQGHHHTSPAALAAAFSQQTNNNRVASSPTQSDSRLQMFQHQQQSQQQQHNSLRLQAAIAAAAAAVDSRPQQQQSQQHQQQQHQHHSQQQQPQSSQFQQPMSIGNFAGSGWLPAGVNSMAGTGSGGGGLGSMASAFPSASGITSASSMAGNGGLMTMGGHQGSGGASPMDLMRGGGGGGPFHTGTGSVSQPLSPGGYPSAGASSNNPAHQYAAAMQQAASSSHSAQQPMFGPQPTSASLAAAASVFAGPGSVSGPRGTSGGHSAPGTSPGDFMHRSSGHSGGGSPGGANAATLDPFSRVNMMISSPPQPPPPIPPPPSRLHLDYATASLYPDSPRAELHLNYFCENMNYKCQFSDQPKGSQQGIAKSEYFSTLTLSVAPGQQLVFSGSGASVQEAHDAAAVACLRDLNQLKPPYPDLPMHMNPMAGHTEMMGGPPV